VSLAISFVAQYQAGFRVIRDEFGDLGQRNSEQQRNLLAGGVCRPEPDHFGWATKENDSQMAVSSELPNPQP